MLRTESLFYWIEDNMLLNEIDLSFVPNKFHVIMGANGAGKTTLMKLLAGDLQPSQGEIYLSNKPLRHYRKKELATKRAVLSQHYQIAFPIGASDIVMMGRYPFFDSSPTTKDREICRQAMEKMQSEEFSSREYNTLSGGEAQKIHMARVLAQIWDAQEGNEKVLFLDEPVSHLDIKYQHELLDIARQLCNQHVTVIAILHDINLALMYADHIVFLKGGHLIHETMHPSDVTSEIIRTVFDVDANVLDLSDGKRVVVF